MAEVENGNLLLDTHVVLWWRTDDARLTADAHQSLRRAGVRTGAMRRCPLGRSGRCQSPATSVRRSIAGAWISPGCDGFVHT